MRTLGTPTFATAVGASRATATFCLLFIVIIHIKGRGRGRRRRILGGAGRKKGSDVCWSHSVCCRCGIGVAGAPSANARESYRPWRACSSCHYSWCRLAVLHFLDCGCDGTKVIKIFPKLLDIERAFGGIRRGQGQDDGEEVQGGGREDG